MAASLVVLESFIGRVGKADVIFRAGDLVKADNEAVKKWPRFFGEPDHVHDRVEQATAAPGEKRGS